jgi:hypothetical protein
MDAKISSQNQNNELQVSTTIYHQFKLPNDWVVVRRCRSKRGNRRSHNDKVIDCFSFSNSKYTDLLFCRAFAYHR